MTGLAIGEQRARRIGGGAGTKQRAATEKFIHTDWDPRRGLHKSYAVFV